MPLAVNSSRRDGPSILHPEGFVLEADLHCHLLPAWDDGPRDLESSLKMAATASECGVRRVVVTPHVGRAFGATERPASDIHLATKSLQHEIIKAGIELELIPGAEIMLSVLDLPNRVKNEPWLTVGGANRYVLVEAPSNVWSEMIDNILFAISLSGLIPIIAHPERVSDVQNDISIMERAVERGAVLQITARSVVGPNRSAKACCHRLLRAGLVSLIASDAHNSRHLWPPTVAPNVEKIIGKNATSQMLKDNPMAVLAGDPISPMPSRISKPKKFWFW